jgi:hypothetical protein
MGSGITNGWILTAPQGNLLWFALIIPDYFQNKEVVLTCTQGWFNHW